MMLLYLRDLSAIFVVELPLHSYSYAAHSTGLVWHFFLLLLDAPAAD